MTAYAVAGTSLNVVEQGNGMPVLLVHGFPLDHSMWNAQIAPLALRYRVLAVDLRGFGASRVSAGAVNMRQFADDLAELLRVLAIDEPVVFCGLSMGGYIAWQFARHHADRLRALILCDTKAAADTAEAAQQREKTAQEVLVAGPEPLSRAMTPKLFASCTIAEQPAVVEAMRAVMLRTNPLGIAAALRGMAQRSDMTSLLPQIRVPTLVVCGEHDAITPAAEMRSLAAAIPHARFALIPNAGHMAPLEKPAIVNAALSEFLAELD